MNKRIGLRLTNVAILGHTLRVYPATPRLPFRLARPVPPSYFAAFSWFLMAAGASIAPVPAAAVPSVVIPRIITAAPAPETPALSEADAVMLALKNSTTLEIARRERNVALIEAQKNKPGFAPDIQATASEFGYAPRVELPGKAGGVVTPNSVSRLEIAMKQPIYQVGAGKAPGQRAAAMAGAARSDYRKAELDTILEAREAYLALAPAEAFTGVAREGRDLAKKHLDQTKLLRERGVQADVDVLDAERSEAETELGVTQAENGITLARGNLNRLIGRDLDSPVRTTAEPVPDSPLPQLSELRERAVRNRPELEALRENLAAAEAGIKLAKASRLPRVSLEVAYGLQNPTVLVPESGLMGGVSVSMPLFSSAATRYTIREAEERAAQLKVALRAQEQGIELEILRQISAWTEAQSRQLNAQSTEAKARRVYETALLLLERGRTIQLQVEGDRLSLQRALTDQAGARNDLLVARARLDRALGEGPTLEPSQKSGPETRQQTENKSGVPAGKIP